MTVGVIGAGVMGAGIARVFAVGGDRVVLVDVADAVLDRARTTIRSGRFGLEGATERGLLDEPVDTVEARISFASDLDAVAACDLVIEAVPEDLDVKTSLFRGLDARCGPDTILASNSSGLPIAAMAAATGRPDRVIGWHWASPAQVMAFAEIVVTEQTSEATTATVVAAADRLGKHPIVVRDHPETWGYVANRIYMAAMREAQAVVADGVAAEADVDRLLVDCYRWPVGPFTMMRGAREGWTE